MQNDDGYLEVTGNIMTVIYTNAENGYTVLRLQEETTGEEISVVGCIPGAAAGENITVTGTWVTHPSYGGQLKAESATRRLPTERNRIFDYLSSGAIKGVGAATAAVMVSRFGSETLSIIADSPEKLAEIKGISLQKARAIGKEFRRQASLRMLMEFLSRYGLKASLAVKLYKTYGDMAVDMLNDNPYIITSEYFGADFYEADSLALSLGYESTSHQRVEAALVFELRHNLNNGHTFLPEDKLLTATIQLIGAEADAVQEGMHVLEENGLIVKEKVANVTAVYLQSLYSAECYTAERILQMRSIPVSGSVDTDKIISDIETEYGIQYADFQRKAIKMAAENRIMVLTGGPGTGKTTAVRGILSVFQKLKITTALTAPTGRAAKRMSELTGYDASTVHRLLEAGMNEDGDDIIFNRDENDPLKADAVILDEASMMDVMLMKALLCALRPDCRLVLVGDADQLPPVGPGNVFFDIIRSAAVPTVRLTEIFRQAQESGIIRSAHRINGGQVPELAEKKGDFFFLQRTSNDKIADTVVELCASRLPKNMGIPSGQIQVLAPGKKGEAGTYNLNLRLQAAENPPAKTKREVMRPGFAFREGDRVMQVRNNYDIVWRTPDSSDGGTGIFNGDIGTIVQIDSVSEVITIDFEDRVADYTFDMVTELEPAYAMTVHKSQGSEYRAVILALSRAVPVLLTRNILYTAVTRARQLLIIVGEGETINDMVKNDRKQRRYSGLKTRLCQND